MIGNRGAALSSKEENILKYTEGEVITKPTVRNHKGKVYVLSESVTFPFTCVNFYTEEVAGNWIGSSQSISSEADTSTTINLSNTAGNWCNMGSANTNETFTYSNEVLGGNATVLINCANEPTVTGATKVFGSYFQANTDMYLYLYYNGEEVQYYFIKI